MNIHTTHNVIYIVLIKRHISKTRDISFSCLTPFLWPRSVELVSCRVRIPGTRGQGIVDYKH